MGYRRSAFPLLMSFRVDWEDVPADEDPLAIDYYMVTDTIGKGETQVLVCVEMQTIDDGGNNVQVASFFGENR